MRRTLTLILGVALFGILTAVVVAAQNADDPAGSQAAPVTHTVDLTKTVEDNPKPRDRKAANDNRAEDVSGPCDEAEHANDPRCTGQPTAVPQGDDDQGVDDSAGRVDNSGPGSENSGPGSVHSGRDDEVENEVETEHHGGGDDDGGDDHSGPGGGGDDD